MRDPEDDEEFEVIDVRKQDWLKAIVGDLTHASAAKQTVVGGISGWSDILSSF